MSKTRQAVLEDFFQPKFKGENTDDYEVRQDGGVVRKDRWEKAIYSIVHALGMNGRDFECAEVVDGVRGALRMITDRNLVCDECGAESKHGANVNEAIVGDCYFICDTCMSGGAAQP